MHSAIPSPHLPSLEKAVERGDILRIQSIAEAGGNLNGEDGTAPAILTSAIAGNAQKVVPHLLRMGARIDEALLCAYLDHDSLNQSTLMWLTQRMLNQSNPSDQPPSASALQHAASKGDIESTKTLLSAGIDINAHAGTPLHCLALCPLDNEKVIIRLLLSAGADRTANCAPYGNSLFDAVRTNNLHGASTWLMMHPEDARAINDHGHDLLSFAQKYGADESIGRLITEAQQKEPELRRAKASSGMVV